jgi:hypothetical protein
MDQEFFMTRISQWRAAHPVPTEAYIAAIPRHVLDSMSFEGDQVDIRFLEANLEAV